MVAYFIGLLVLYTQYITLFEGIHLASLLLAVLLFSVEVQVGCSCCSLVCLDRRRFDRLLVPAEGRHVL